MIIRRDRLDGVHPLLRAVAIEACGALAFDVLVVEGARSLLRQQSLYAQGRTTAHLREIGVTGIEGRPDLPRVTWTLQSKHIPGPDGFSRAIDLAPISSGIIEWSRLDRFDAIAAAMFAAAGKHAVAIRWGADWDGDGKRRERGESDSPHFELAT